MHPITALRLARVFHRVFPFSQLRFADIVGRMIGPRPLTAEVSYFGSKIRLDLHRSECRQLFIGGERWLEDATALRQQVQPGMTVVDIGANIGYVTLALAQLVGPTGRVFAFEPETANFSELSANIKSNRLINCTAIHAAVGDSDGMTNIVAGGTNSYIGSEGTPVPMTTLDSFAGKVGRIDFVKIDVEGFELAVLNGMERMIGESHPKLHVEVHPVGTFGHGDPAAVTFHIDQRYRSLRLYLLPSSLTRQERLTSFIARRSMVPVSFDYLYQHPERRYLIVASNSSAVYNPEFLSSR